MSLDVQTWIRPYLEINRTKYLHLKCLKHYSLEVLVHDLVRHQHEEGGDGGLMRMVRHALDQPLDFQIELVSVLNALHLFEEYDTPTDSDTTFFLTNLYLYSSPELATHILDKYGRKIHTGWLGDLLCMVEHHKLKRSVLDRILGVEVVLGIRVWEGEERERIDFEKVETEPECAPLFLRDEYDGEDLSNEDAQSESDGGESESDS